MSDISDLTERQQEIASMVRCGLSNKEIAKVLGIATGSVTNTLASIYRKLDIQGPKGAKRTKLAVMVVEEKKYHHGDHGGKNVSYGR